MDTQRWYEIERLYHAAAEQEPGARAAFLQQACGGDQELQREVESLLAGQTESSAFLEAPALEMAAKEFASESGPASQCEIPIGRSYGHYRIAGKLGEGGMGEVYRAHDTQLNRAVAIKVLPAAFAGDARYMARFEREAHMLASLNHPNIAAIYGVEQGAIVMELVEGEQLHGPLPIEEAIPIARQIASALETAHEKGIVHRDLKPANIKVTAEGVVKLLDFGLARACEEPPVNSNPAISPAPSAPRTMEGMILGTAAYMSPEQARGKTVDKRTDIWAFGVVLFELLTGERLYAGETANDSIAAVITREPEWQALPKDTPPHVRRLLERCLRKDPKLRLRDIGEARILLEEPGEAAPEASATRRSWLLWVTAGACATLALGMGVMLWRATRPVERPVLRFNADMGPEALAGNRISAIISPDGTRLAYLVRHGETEMLATRGMDQSSPTILLGTENAIDPFFSFDGQWIGFSAGGYLKKISIQGGAPTPLCEVEVVRGASWGEDGSIVFGSAVSGLARVPADGGPPRTLTKPSEKGESTHRFPQILPGSKAVLFTGATSNGRFDDANIEVLFLKTGETRVVQRGGYYGRYLPSGHLVFVHQGALFAVPFDLSSYRTAGIPAPVLEDVAANPNAGGGQLDFSRTGTVVYLTGNSGAAQSALFWLDAAGKKEPLVSAPDIASPRFSPDGKRLAFSSGGISVYDLARGATIHLTTDRSANDLFPVWTPDGSHIVYSSIGGIWWVRSDGSGRPQLLYQPKAGNGIPWSFSPDGRRLAFHQTGDHAGRELWTLPVDTADPNNPKAGGAELFLGAKGSDLEPAFSPDGRWLAYSSTEGGESHVFVRPFPESAQGGGQEQISTGAGRFPVWSRTAKEIFYVAGDNHIVVVPYTINGPAFEPGKPRFWAASLLANTGYNSPYDLAPDGKRFAVFPSVETSSGGPKENLHLTFLLNFFDELKRRVPLQRK